MKTLIKNGNIVTSSETFKADLLIEDEIIKEIGIIDESVADTVIGKWLRNWHLSGLMLASLDGRPLKAVCILSR